MSMVNIEVNVHAVFKERACWDIEEPSSGCGERQLDGCGERLLDGCGERLLDGCGERLLGEMKGCWIYSETRFKVFALYHV